MIFQALRGQCITNHSFFACRHD